MSGFPVPSLRHQVDNGIDRQLLRRESAFSEYRTFANDDPPWRLRAMPAAEYETYRCLSE